MDNNPILRAADNLFSENTIIIFIQALAFLWCFNTLRKATIKIINKNWLNVLVTAWITFIFFAIIFQVFKTISNYINLKRFGTIVDSKIEPGALGRLIMAAIIFAILYTIYSWICEHLGKRISNITNRSIAEGLILFILSNTIIISFSTLFGLKANVTGIIHTSATWIQPIFAYTLAVIFYNYSDYIRKFKFQEKELQISRLQQQLSHSQLDALSAKVNPHFLYNALNSIAGLATTNALKTRDMAIALSKLFRYNINKEESNYVSIKDEMEMVLTYLEIEKIRFDDQLQYTCSIPTEIENELIPRHLLQPLVENAVKHGVGLNGVEIRISIEKQNHQIILQVGDNGKPFDTNFNPGYGIKSLYEKLDLLAAKNYEIAFLSDPKAVSITLAEYKV